MTWNLFTIIVVEYDVNEEWITLIRQKNSDNHIEKGGKAK